MAPNTWTEVIFREPGDGYSWDSFDVRWTGERWAWSQQSGCSCDAFEHDPDGYTEGTKAELIRAVHEWAGGHSGGPVDVLAVMAAVSEFRAQDDFPERLAAAIQDHAHPDHITVIEHPGYEPYVKIKCQHCLGEHYVRRSVDPHHGVPAA